MGNEVKAEGLTRRLCRRCKSNTPDIRSKGGPVVIYKAAEELRDAAQGFWIGGILFSGLICAGSFFLFWIGSRRKGADAE